MKINTIIQKIFFVLLKQYKSRAKSMINTRNVFSSFPNRELIPPLISLRHNQTNTPAHLTVTLFETCYFDLSFSSVMKTF